MPHLLSKSTLKWLILPVGAMLILWACQTTFSAQSTENVPDVVDFNYHIRPILSNNCYVCHGPDPSSREAGLRLDTYEGATALLESGSAAIIPGKSGRSHLIQRITSEDPEQHMPPPNQNKQLSPYEVALLEKWIEQGAEYKPHWAFIPPQKPTIPTGKKITDTGNEIDAFIQEKLTEKGLKLAPGANRMSLLRRLSFVLTGLPPTPAELRVFETDASEDAYEKQVDRLLASPHFGERWARHWMDVVRYAESRGHEFDYPVLGAWRYRDYLIRAFNADVPYDQFVREHLAGDMIENPRLHPEKGFNESVYGTAFYTLGEGKHSPVDIRKEESDIIDNMIDVTSKTFQGLTVSCAKCHDHKFDPIPTKDYYSLYGIFESSRVTAHPADMTAASLRGIDSLQQLKQAIRQTLAGSMPQAVVQPVRQFERAPVPEVPQRADCHEVLGDFRKGAWPGWYSDGIAFGDKPVLGDPVFDESGTRLLRFEPGKASSKQLALNLPGALRSPNFIIEFDSLIVRAAGEGGVIRVVVDNFQLIQWPIHGYLRQELDDPTMREYHFHLADLKGEKAYVEFLPGRHFPHKGEANKSRNLYRQPENAWVEVEYAITFDDTVPDMRSRIVPATDPIAAIQAWKSQKASAAQVALLNQLLQKGQLEARTGATQELIKAYQTLADKPLFNREFILGMTEGDGVNSPVFIRGNHLQVSEEPVKRRFFAALPEVDVSFEGAGSKREELAEGMLHPQNPLTARVMVNRIWHHLYGRGIVETVDNFGAQGTLPTHPELLDFLAIRFQEEGWSMKKMMRLMVLSATFRQSTQVDSSASAADPLNHLWHHYPVRRLEGEAIRDAILATSDCLDPTMMGESVPVYLTEFMKGRGRPGLSGPLDGDGRRSIYTTILRNFLPPMMLVFDMPAPFSAFGKRNVSNVPAQSLTLMNDPFVIEQAGYWAKSILKSASQPEARIEAIYLRALSRKPNAEEVAEGITFLKAQAASYGCEGEGALDEFQIWQDYCHALFNVKEFIHLI